MAFNQNEAFQNPEERQLQEWRGQALARLVGSWARNNAPDRVQAGPDRSRLTKLRARNVPNRGVGSEAVSKGKVPPCSRHCGRQGRSAPSVVVTTWPRRMMQASGVDREESCLNVMGHRIKALRIRRFRRTGHARDA